MDGMNAMQEPDGDAAASHHVPGTFRFFKGRVALYASLQAMGVGEGDEVIIPGFTCIVVPNAIRFLGARPVYVDVDPDTYNMRTDLVEPAITGRTRAILAQHTFGIPAAMDALSGIARDRKLYLIEDCAHTIGSRWHGREVGSFGDVSIFSSQWSKPITTGLGGWAVVNNPALVDGMHAAHRRMRACSWRESLVLRLQYLAFVRLFKPSRFWFAQNTYRMFSELGVGVGSTNTDEVEGRMSARYATRMGDWQTRRLTLCLNALAATVEHRRRIALVYDRLLGERGLTPFVAPQGCDTILLRYPLLVDNKDVLLTKARKNKIELGDWFVSPVHPARERWEAADYEAGSCPVAEDLCRRVVNLPTHNRVQEDEAKRIVDFVAEHDRT